MIANTNTLAHLALAALLTAPFASAILIPRDPAITITQTLTNTVMSTQTVPYSSVASGTNPINGLPAAPPSSSSSKHSTSSRVSFSIITVPTPQSSATLTPVPYGTYTPADWINTTSHASSTVHPSSSTATTRSHARTPLAPFPTTLHSESTSSSHSKPTTSTTLSSSQSHTASTTTRPCGR
ncbi:hypothetical protein LTR56_010581 [Elasticomyces elasticus]|nr:hypothetical protein LTR56_010581 [Elasticomyces elasticus]KAK4932437.1 hypothetical protein LTR49_001306 [Elasticomyces elasticus]KAK5760138.1 hypothetical protein LTS12_009693 [Elasticomyces elasticus]